MKKIKSRLSNYFLMQALLTLFVIPITSKASDEESIPVGSLVVYDASACGVKGVFNITEMDPEWSHVGQSKCEDSSCITRVSDQGISKIPEKSKLKETVEATGKNLPNKPTISFENLYAHLSDFFNDQDTVSEFNDLTIGLVKCNVKAKHEYDSAFIPDADGEQGTQPAKKGSTEAVELKREESSLNKRSVASATKKVTSKKKKDK